MKCCAILAKHSPVEIHRPAALRAAEHARAMTDATRLGAQTSNSPRAHICVSSRSWISRRSAMQGTRSARSIQASIESSSACRAMSRAFS
jgi:hypothetical protein